MATNTATREFNSTVQPRKAAARQACLWLSFLFSLVLWANVFAAQQLADPAFAQALNLYKSGDARGAVAALQSYLNQHKEHADAWHVLGLAHYNLGNVKDARKAFEKATMLRPNHEPSHINLAFIALFTNDLKKAEKEASLLLSINPQSAEAHYIFGKIKLDRGDTAGAMTEATASLHANAAYANSYWLKTQALVNSYADRYKNHLVSLKQDDPQRMRKEADRAQLFKAAAENLERYLALNSKLKGAAFWQGQLEALRAYAGAAGASDPAEAMSAATRPTILSREKASYTEEARSRGVQGAIVVMVIFSADGTLKHPLVLKSLGYGLDEATLRAVSKIRFAPATRDGKPISVIGNLEFSFNLY